MNSVFNLNRFGKLVKAELLINKKSFIRILALLVLLGALYWIGIGVDMIFHTVSLIAIFPFFLYKNVHHKDKGIVYAMLPATPLEKILSAIILVNVFSIVFLVAFTLAIALISTLLGNDIAMESISNEIFPRFFIIITMQSIVLFSMFGFSKNKILKFILLLLLLMGIAFLIAYLQIPISIGNTIKNSPFIPLLFYTAAFLKFRKTQANA